MDTYTGSHLSPSRQAKDDMRGRNAVVDLQGRDEANILYLCTIEPPV